MKILRSWLSDYIESDLTDEGLADKLSLSGTSVESIKIGLNDGIVIVEILKIEPHPNADRLQIAIVSDGEHETNVVCGAPNIAVGQKVPLATIGTVLPGGKIEKSKIRGVESFGMLCAPDELGLSDDHDGILVLPEDYELGKKLNSYLGNETVFDLEVTPNRGDCLSHLGVAREVAVLSGKSIKKQPVKIDSISKNANSLLSLQIKDTKLCPQYQARVIENIKIQESPDWLKKRLSALGAKPINNVVDITNYIMLDLGQPLHAFDLEKVGKSIIVRRASKAEKIVTLDNIERNLSEKNLVIASEKESIAIAGVMGGKNSEIDSATTAIVLEAAVFSATNIRATAKSLNLSTEASYRFERGIDANLVEYALNKAANMIAEIAGGKVMDGIVRNTTNLVSLEIPFEYENIINILGASLRNDEINHYLKLLGFEIKNNIAVAPSWRHDVTCWQDLAEEVGRIHGYNHVSPIPMSKSGTQTNSIYYFYEYLKDILVKCGFTEVMNYTLLSEEDLKTAQLKPSTLLEVSNPMQPENKYLRNSLVPGLLKVVAKNPTFDSVLVFEIANIFTKSDETKMLSIVSAGKDAQNQIASAVKELCDKIGLKTLPVREITKEEITRFKIRKASTYVVEIELSDIAKKFLKSNQPELLVTKKSVHYRPISKYPSVTRDLAFIVDKATKADELIENIYSVSELINRVELFDEFASDKLGVGKKNLAYHIYLQKMDKTMVDVEADEIIKSIVKKIEKTFNAKLRA